MYSVLSPKGVNSFMDIYGLNEQSPLLSKQTSSRKNSSNMANIFFFFFERPTFATINKFSVVKSTILYYAEEWTEKSYLLGYRETEGNVSKVLL